MSKFMEIKTEVGDFYLLNAAEVVFLKAREGNWERGAYVGLGVNASDYKGLQLGQQEARRVREWLLSL